MDESIKVPDNSRILIVKLSSIGDVVMATPVAKAIRTAYPNAYIGWVVESKSKDVVLGNPYVDEVIVWDRRSRPGWSPRALFTIAKSLRELSRELKARKFDIAVDVQGLLRSGLVTRLSGAPCRVGYGNARECSTTFYTHLFPAHRHGGVRGPQMYLNLLQMLGVHSQDLDMHMVVDEADRESMRNLLRQEAVEDIVSLCPATTWPNKHWTEDGWAGAADLLAQEHGLTPVFLGAPVDHALVGRIMAKMKCRAVSVVGKTTIKQAAALLDLSRLAIGVDSGLLHIAVALDKPVIGVFGPSGWRNFIKKDSFAPVAKEFPCIPCFRHPTCKEYDCMKAISPRDVLDAADRLIGERTVTVCPDMSNDLPNAAANLQRDPGGRKLRTIHIETGMHSLGGPAQVVYLMTGLKNLGHEAILICPKGSSVADDAISAGLDVMTVPMPSDLDLTFVPRLYSILKRVKPDIVHLHSRRGADVLGGIAARLAGVPAVVLSRRIDNPVRHGLLSSVKYGLLCDKIITVSNAIKDVLIQGGADPSKIVCVHSIVDAPSYDVGRDEELRAELGIPATSPLIAIVAQLIERKGHSYLFNAMPAILKRYPDARLLVLGRGALEAKLKNQVESLGIRDNVVFAGFRRDIPKLLHEFDMLVHPASMEGLGVAILQAMAAGVPVVATPVGGIPEAVKDGVNGLLVPPQDSDAIADAVIKLLDDPELRARMGRNGRAIVEDKFCPERMVEGVISVYKSVLETKARSHRRVV